MSDDCKHDDGSRCARHDDPEGGASREEVTALIARLIASAEAQEGPMPEEVWKHGSSSCSRRKPA
jgi:hypothetical protein